MIVRWTCGARHGEVTFTGAAERERWIAIWAHDLQISRVVRVTWPERTPASVVVPVPSPATS